MLKIEEMIWGIPKLKLFGSSKNLEIELVLFIEIRPNIIKTRIASPHLPFKEFLRFLLITRKSIPFFNKNILLNFIS